MLFESSIGKAMVQLTDSLSMRVAPALERTGGDVGQDAKVPEQSAVIVTISEAARALIAPEKSGSSADTSQDAEDDRRDMLIEQFKKRIQVLEEELENLKERYDLSDREKTQQIQAKETELMKMREQLMAAELAKLQAAGYTEGGGTRAMGAGKSTGSF